MNKKRNKDGKKEMKWKGIDEKEELGRVVERREVVEEGKEKEKER